MIRYTIALLLYLAACPTQAQTPADKDRKLLRVSSLGEWKSAPLFVKTGAESVTPLSIIDMGYSEPIPVKKARPVQFLKETGNPETPYETVITATIPESVRSPLILLIPVRDKLSYRVFDLDPAKFPYGSYQMVNYSTHPLRVAVDKDIRVLKKKQRLIFPPAEKTAKNVRLRASVEPEGKLVFSSMATQRRQKRVLVFFINRADADRISTRMLVDFQPDPKP